MLDPGDASENICIHVRQPVTYKLLTKGKYSMHIVIPRQLVRHRCENMRTAWGILSRSELPILPQLKKSKHNLCKGEMCKYVFVNAYMHLSRGSRWAGCIYEDLFLRLFLHSSDEYSMCSERRACKKPKREAGKRENVAGNSHSNTNTHVLSHTLKHTHTHGLQQWEERATVTNSYGATEVAGNLSNRTIKLQLSFFSFFYSRCMYLGG